jgi:hypothetical protein
MQWVVESHVMPSSEAIPDGNVRSFQVAPVSVVDAATAFPLPSAPTATHDVAAGHVTALNAPCPGFEPPGVGTAGGLTCGAVVVVVEDPAEPPEPAGDPEEVPPRAVVVVVVVVAVGPLAAWDTSRPIDVAMTINRTVTVAMTAAERPADRPSQPPRSPAGVGGAGRSALPPFGAESLRLKEVNLASPYS